MENHLTIMISGDWKLQHNKKILKRFKNSKPAPGGRRGTKEPNNFNKIYHR